MIFATVSLMPIVMITEAAAAFELGNSKNPFYTSHLILFHALFSVLILILDLHYYTIYFLLQI